MSPTWVVPAQLSTRCFTWCEGLQRSLAVSSSSCSGQQLSPAPRLASSARLCQAVDQSGASPGFKLGDEGSQSFCSAERREASAQECKMRGSILPIMG